jgi:hypothetical protein
VGLLQKPVREYTRQDLATLKKALGVTGRPFPMRDSIMVEDSNGNSTLKQTLGVIEDDANPLWVYSDRSYAEVMGMAMRDMPTPGMLPLFKKALLQRNPTSKLRIQYLKGAPGAGKTYMSEMIARMTSPEGAIKIDCGKKNLAELLFEKVLDTGNNRSFYDELDKRLRNNKLNPFSVRILKESLGEAFIEDHGTARIDWDKIGRDIRDSGGEQVDSGTAVSQAIEGLQRVSKLEGLDSLGGNMLGMATQEGPLIRAWKEGREIVLDEFNRAKEGTTSSLHTVLQFLSGEIDQVTVENTLKDKSDASGQHFTFRRQDQKGGFFVTLTGNSESDGSDVEVLPQSVNSRIIPRYIPLATQEDTQHRICQVLTGLPVSTLYNMSKDQWDRNPRAFQQKLLEWRTMGMTKEQIDNIPQQHLGRLRRWKDIVEVSEKLARFYDGWSKLVNIESPLFKAGNLAELMQEIDENYGAEVSIDFRKAIAHTQEANEVQPHTKNVSESEGVYTGSWLEAPVLPEAHMEPPGFQYGTRLVNIILTHINMTTADIGKMRLHKQIMQLAKDCGLVEDSLHEAQKTDKKSVADLLNDNPYNSDDPDVQAEVIHELECRHLRRTFADIDVRDDQLVNPMKVREELEALLSGDEEPGYAEEPGAPLTLFNENPETLYAHPLQTVRAIDAASIAALGANAPDPDIEELSSRDNFLSALAAPVLRVKALEALWTGALARTGATYDDTENKIPKDQSLAMADGTSDSGLAITTVVTAGQRADGLPATEPLHIIWNRKTDRILVVGEGKIAPDLKSAFNATRGTYVDRNETNAPERVQTALARLIPSDKAKTEDLLKMAFQKRAAMPSAADESKMALKDLLVSKDIKAFLPVYVTNQPELNFYGTEP